MNDTRTVPYYQQQPLPPPPPEPKSGTKSAFRRALTVLAILTSLALGLGLGITIGDDSTELQRASDTKDAVDRRLELVESNNIDLRGEVTDLEGEVSELSSENSRLAGRVETYKGRLTDVRGQLSSQRAQESSGAPSSGDIQINYGDDEWRSLFTFNNLTLGQDFDGTPKLNGTITYSGGGDCEIGYVEVEAIFYSGTQLLASDFTNFTSLPEGTPRGLEITTYDGDGPATSAELTVVEANCDY